VVGAVVAALAVGWGITRLTGGGPDLGVALVDGQGLASCLSQASEPIENWKVRPGPAGEVTSAGTLTIAYVRTTWGARDGDVEPSDASVRVFPTEAGADEFASRFGSVGTDEGGTGYGVDQWNNVVMRRYDGDYRPSPPEPVTDLLYGCMEKAAVFAPSHHGGFEDCDDPGRAHIDDLTVSGESCEEASDLLSRAYSGRGFFCDSLSPEFACVVENICCTLSADYVGNGDIEIVYENSF
jgi:hypothetical protein